MQVHAWRTSAFRCKFSLATAWWKWLELSHEAVSRLLFHETTMLFICVNSSHVPRAVLNYWTKFVLLQSSKVLH